MMKRQKAQVPKHIVCNAAPERLVLPAEELYLCAPEEFDDFFIDLGIWSEEERFFNDPSAS